MARSHENLRIKVNAMMYKCDVYVFIESIINPLNLQKVFSSIEKYSNGDKTHKKQESL